MHPSDRCPFRREPSLQRIGIEKLKKEFLGDQKRIKKETTIILTHKKQIR